jgi:autotransporter-associated beta strand protein
LGLAAVVAITVPTWAFAALSFTVDPNGWPNAAHRNAAINAMQSVVNRYDAYGDFGNYNVWVYYNAGIPTAQASYLGSIGFGGTYPNERVTMHELAHYLGSGTYGHPWNGQRGEALIDQFDGLEAELMGDGAHFWPYGLNFDSEGAEINKQRHVAMVYAQRADMGIGSTANPWTARDVHLTASDPLDESGFNYAARWSDDRFAHPGAAYATGQFLMRTPASGNSFTFAGESLRVNNSNGINGGLLYKGAGTAGVTTFKNLILDGGYVRHASGTGDVFQVAGKITLTKSPTIDAAQGNINISADIGGSGTLTKTGAYTLTLTGANTYSGATIINAGTLRIATPAPVASYTFDSFRSGVVFNSGNGGSAMNGMLAGGATIVSGGRYGNAVSLANGASVDINNPVLNLGNNGSWTVSAWVHTTTAGATILTKGDGSGWANGNTIFYLGDGTAGGSGGVPSAVRYAGGFFQGSTSAAAVNDGNWHLVTYVNNGGSYSIYTDGVAQPLSPGNSGFSNADVGSVVRLGVSTNTFPGDGTVNFNGLLDNVQFYSQPLSAAQVAALYQGQNFAPLPSTTDVTIAAGATLDLNGIVQQIGSLTGTSDSAISLGAGTLVVNSAASTEFRGSMAGAGGSLAKEGTGTLVMSSANMYSGGTTIHGGILSVNNSAGSGTGAGPVNVSNGATLAGTGFISGAVTISSGAHIAPGASIESLDVASLTLASGAILDFELDTIAGVDSSDRINVTGSNGLAVNGGVFNLTNIGGMTAGTYSLIDYAGTLNGSINNMSFGALPSGFQYSLVNNTAATSIDLIVSPLLVGDFNNNGVVDTADYVAWRRNVGQPAGTLPNDDTGLVIGDEQYALWRAHFGMTSSDASELPAAAPEPNSFSCMLLLSIMAAFRRSSRL